MAEEAASQRAYAHDRERIDDAKGHPVRTMSSLLLLGFGPALGLMTLVWLVYGRERKTAYDREYEQEPPTDTEPALVPSLVRQGTVPGSNEFTATLFDLIRRGRYKATPVTTERPVFGGLRHEDVADLEVTLADPKVETTPFEEPVAKVVDSVVDTEGERLSKFREEIERDRTANSKLFTSFKEGVTAEIEARGWYLGQGLGLAGRRCRRVRGRGGRPAVGRHPRLALRRAALERRRARHAGRVRRGQRRRAALRREAIGALAPPERSRPRPRPSAGRRSAAT